MSLKSCLLICVTFVVIVFVALTWRLWQLEIIRYQQGIQRTEVDWLPSYLDSHFILGNDKDDIFKALEPIPHRRVNFPVRRYMPKGTVECYFLTFPTVLFMFPTDSDQVICFDEKGRFTYRERYYS